jgi:hypothetical protein
VAVKLRNKIRKRLRTIFTQQQLEELRYILSEGRSLRDIEGELRRNYTTLQIYERFESWIRTASPKDKEDLAFELKLFHKILSYEINSMFRNWYPREKRKLKNLYLKKGKDPIMDKKKNEITSSIQKVNWDPSSEDEPSPTSLDYPKRL